MPVLDWYVVRGTLLPFLDRSSVRQAAFGTVLAILVSYNAVLTLGFGFIGSPGNSVATGALLFTLPPLLFLLSFRGELHLRAADFFYAGYAGIALLSFLINDDAPTKEHLLLVATLSGYVACRPLVASDIQVARSAFERITAVIILVGAFVTAAELFRDGVPGKPMVFGFNAAGTYFTVALGLLIIALVTVDRPRPRRTIAISALVFLPTAIFAAAMVRFTFLALAGTLLVAIILTERGKRGHIAVVAIVIFFAILVGLGSRYSTTKMYAAYIVEQPIQASIATTPAQALPGFADPPSCSLTINTRNSIAIRRSLARDALYLTPAVGPFGTGLDSFLRFSCIQAHQVHISILQAAVELGWLGGSFFVALMGLAIHGLVPLARQSGAVRFILCSLVFCIFLSMAHGRISRDISLFAFLGCAVGISKSRIAFLSATEANDHSDPDRISDGPSDTKTPAIDAGR
jgi:hypothetical protein